MLPNPTRVAYRHLTAAPVDNLISTVQDALASATARANELVSTVGVLERLIAKGKSRGKSRHDRGKENRVDRARDIANRLSGIQPSGSKMEAKVPSTQGGTYNTKVAVDPPAYSCTCVDHKENGKRGPCKHVMGLSLYWRDKVAAPALEEMADSLVGSVF
jgi:hypothetical protein